MKKILTVALVVVAMMTAGNANAQTKMGYISIDFMVSRMPDIGRIDTLLQKFQVDSLNPQYAYLISEYNRKDSMVNTKDSVKTPPAVRAQIRQELMDIANTVQNWQQLTNQAMEAKQNEYLRPVYTKVYDAIKAVAKEKGYTHVFNKEAFIVAPDGDDITLDVAKKLKVVVPQQSDTKPAPPKSN